MEVGNTTDVESMALKSGSQRKQLLGPDYEKTLGRDELLVRAYMLAGDICKRTQEYSPRALSAMCRLAMLLGEHG